VTVRQNVSVEALVSQVLRFGVLLAFVIVCLGGAMYLSQHHGQEVAFAHFSGGESDLRTIGSIVVLALHLRSDALIQLGLLVLIATPVARVLMSAIGFAIDRDGLYVLIGTIVFAVLMYGLLHAT
jgi:uncharacterized membrane protein